jgi:hypothetical protein
MAAVQRDPKIREVLCTPSEVDVEVTSNEGPLHSLGRATHRGTGATPPILSSNQPDLSPPTAHGVQSKLARDLGPKRLEATKAGGQ